MLPFFLVSFFFRANVGGGRGGVVDARGKKTYIDVGVSNISFITSRVVILVTHVHVPSYQVFIHTTFICDKCQMSSIIHERVKNHRGAK